MADTQALRSRRSRQHRAGDHSLCRPGRLCTGAPAAALAPSDPGLGPRAQKLWDEMGGSSLDPLGRLLLDEACRCVDRLDLLRCSTAVTAMTEARHQLTALKGLCAEIRRRARPPKHVDPQDERSGSASAATSSDAGVASPPDAGGPAAFTDFATRLAEKRAAAAQHTPDHLTYGGHA